MGVVLTSSPLNVLLYREVGVASYFIINEDVALSTSLALGVTVGVVSADDFAASTSSCILSFSSLIFSTNSLYGNNNSEWVGGCGLPHLYCPLSVFLLC